jgi:hypothetical protein
MMSASTRPQALTCGPVLPTVKQILDPGPEDLRVLLVRQGPSLSHYGANGSRV